MQVPGSAPRHSINILLQSDWFSAMQVPYTVCHEHSSLSTCAQVLPPASPLLPCPCKSFSHFKSQLKTLTAISFIFSSPYSYFCSPKRQYEAFEQFNFPLYRKSPLLYIMCICSSTICWKDSSSLLYCLCSFAKDQLNIFVWVCFCAVYSVPLIYSSVLLLIPYFVDYY